MATRKTSKGRQRVEMKKIKNKSQLQVTFSKRCAGLFKKASELCTLCGVEIGIIVFSPAGKPFSFGHLSIESIVEKYLKKAVASNSNVNTTESPLSDELHQQMQWLLEQQETEKTKAEMLEELRQAGRKQFWWEAPVGELGLLELQQLQAALEELKKNVVSTQVDLLLLPSDTSHLTPNTKGEVTSEGQFSDDAYISLSSYQIQPHSYEPNFYCPSNRMIQFDY